VNGRTEDKHENPIIVIGYPVTAKVMLSLPRWNTEGIEVQPHSFLTLVPDGHEWTISCPSKSLGENPGTSQIGGWVGPRVSTNILEKLKTLTPARI
jgi:hypothetical protein